MSKNIFYVYIHYRLSDNLPFYVGKGKKKRHSDKVNRSEWWKRIVEKHGFYFKLVSDCLSEVDALELEKQTIHSLRQQGVVLCNFTDGGEGTSGSKQSPETIRKRVEKNTGKKRTDEQRKRLSIAQTGKTRTEEQKKAQSNRLKGVPRDAEVVKKTAVSNTGKKRTPEQIERMTEALKKSAEERNLRESSRGNRNPSASKKIYTFTNVTTGEVFTGTRCDFAEFLNIKPSRLNVLFNKPEFRRKHVLKWRLNDTDQTQEKIEKYRFFW